MKRVINVLLVKSVHISVVSLGIFLFTSVAIAGDERVNCRNVVTDQVPVYTGYSSCSAYYMEQSYSLEEYVFAQSSSYKVLKRIVRYGNHDVEVSCSAPVPFSHMASITKEVCDYTPKMIMRMHRMEDDTVTLVWVEGTDRDGHIVKTELWVNGVKQSGSSAQLAGNQGDRFSVKGKVTDNDGYSDEWTKDITLIYRPGNRN